MTQFTFRPFLSLVRQQHPVGQGGFHTACLTGSDQVTIQSLTTVPRTPIRASELQWVYDCGSERLDAVEAAIAGCYGATHPWIDIVFISHMDDDHFNGMKSLLATVQSVGTIALPYLDHAERAFIFARHVSQGRVDQARSSIADILANPVNALRALGVRRILFVRSGDVPDAEEGFILDGPPGPDREGAPWKLAGPDGRLPNGRVIEDNGGTVVAEISDRSVIFSEISGSQLKWIFKPYIRPADPIKIRAFLDAAAVKLKWDPSTIFDQLKDPAALKALFDDDEMAIALGEAYKQVFAVKNRTTLCVYAGPEAEVELSDSRWAFCFDDHSYVHRRTIGWLGTGDAELKTSVWTAHFLAHYQSEFGRTRVLQLPHHGSAHNFHPDLLSLAPRHCVASAWPKNAKWKHPSQTVKDAVKNAGISFQHVTYSRSHLEGFITDL